MQLTKHWAATLDDYAIDLAWSPDGALLAAASTSGPVSLFSSVDGAKLHTLPGHDNGTNCLAWRPGQNSDQPPILATGGQDGAVKWWDAKNGQHVTTSQLGTAWVEHISWRPMPKADDGGPITTNSTEGKEVRGQASGNGAQISDAQPSSGVPSGSVVPSSSPEFRPASPVIGPLSSDRLAAVAGRELFFLNPDGSTKHRMKPAPKTITALAWQPAGGCAAIAYFGGVCLWDADDFHAQKEFVYNNGIHGLVWSPDSKWLVSGNQDPSVHLWIPEQDAELHMSGYESKVKHLSFDYTSHWLATGGGRDACVWDCSGEGPEGREPAMFPHDAPVCALAFQHRHGLLASASQDGVVMLWSPGRKQPLRATVKMPVAATKLAWSPDDRLLAIGSEQGTVYVLKCEG